MTRHRIRDAASVLWSVMLAMALPALIGCQIAATPRAALADAETRGNDGAFPGSEITFEYFGGLEPDPDVPAPSEVIGHEIGQWFTRHDSIVRYLEALDDASDRVRMQQYGWTHQRRPLHLLTISSPENIARLDDILESNRALADPEALDESEARVIIERNPAVVWFSYNVHGNEASCSEAAMQVAYTMAAGRNEEILRILDDVVLVIDPMLNPDGRERYVSFIDNALGTRVIADPDAAEHDEPWPQGRTNHYLFDLNRDWLWLVHPESQSRMAAYRQYLPQLHIDFHEQGYRSPYFFGAGDTPYNKNIPQETKDWIELYGNANAEVFDRIGLVYSTKERFDYLYPGYGKVLPVYHGAVGLLCEQAGHSMGGVAIEVSERYTLTLRERARNHFLTSMSYLETTASNREGQLDRFRRFFTESMRVPDGAPQLFVVSGVNDPALLEKVWTLCEAHGVEVERTTARLTTDVMHDYRDGDVIDGLEIPEGSWVIRAGQAKGRLARVMFERETEVEDPDTYDITSWSLPVAFGLKAWYSTEPISIETEPMTSWVRPEAMITGEGEVAILIDAAQHAFPQIVGFASAKEMFARFAGEDLVLEGRSFGKGSLIVHRVRNEQDAWDQMIRRARETGVDVHLASSGLTERGPVFGANANTIMTMPRVLLVRGEPMSSLSYGQVWHLLDIESPVPHVPVNVDAMGGVDLGAYTVMVLPESWGSLGGALGEGTVSAIRAWVRGGGSLVAIGSSARWVSRELLELEQEAEDEESVEAKRPELRELTWEQRDERGVEDRVPGSMLRAVVDRSHPLAAGVPEWVGVLKRGADVLPVDSDGYVIARFDAEPVIGGVISERNAKRIAGSPFMTHHRMGRGNVICLSDDPTIRGFNHASMRLLLNAIIFGPSL